MAFQPLSVGDILMLSQMAWRVGRAFVQKNAPNEFAQVEREANDLSNALKLSAEALHADDSILARADAQTLQAIWSILASAEKSLSDLESFVERYQVIKKRETSGGGGYVVERSWGQAVLANYRTLKWTTEGSNIKQLQDVLRMHTDTIALTMQALQTRSLSRLERTVMPMAENIASIHERVNDDLSSKIDDVHRVVMAVANSTPSLQARERTGDVAEHRRHLSNGAASEVSFLLDSPPVEGRRESDGGEWRDGLRRDSAMASTRSPQALLALASPPRAMGSSSGDSWLLDVGPSRDEPERRESLSVYSGPSTSSISGSPTSTRRPSLVAIREYRALASAPWPRTDLDVQEGLADSPSLRDHGVGRESRAGAMFGPSSPSLSEMQPVAHRRAEVAAATPGSLLRLGEGGHAPRGIGSPESTPVSSCTSPSGQCATFERSLFRNAAILCDAQATLVEYARHNKDEPDRRYDTEMVPICHRARICVIRKRENREHGGTTVATSIWALSEDASMRCQQKLSEHQDNVPYSSYFAPEKVSLAASVADGFALRCHGKSWSDLLDKEIRTSWINYVFDTPVNAATFQSAVYGRTLIGSFRTSKTTVIHEGFRGVFAIEEQFAKMDRLRLFEDDGVATPGAEGGVMALLHVSSSFGDGWTRFWVNSSRQQVYLKKDGERCVKVKGLSLTLAGSSPVMSSPARRPSIIDEHLIRVETARPSTKQVRGLRMEFETLREREDFLMLCRRVQERMLPLPPL